jgi:Rrf2 family protein
MLSQKAKYGLKALLALARQTGSDPLLVADLARQESIPQKFLELILLQLRNQGLLQSRKGRGGGYLLLQPAEAITLGRVIRILDGPLAPVPCASVTAYRKCRDCADEETCGVRLVMKQVRDATAGILDHTTLADVAVGRGKRPHRGRRVRRRGP